MQQFGSSTNSTVRTSLSITYSIGMSAGRVVGHDLITLVNIALGTAPPSAYPHGIPNGSAVDIALIIQAVNHALNGCGVG